MSESEKDREVRKMHRDPTADAAVGRVNREWKQMIRKAIALKKTNREMTPEEQQMFTGIYAQLLNENEITLEKMKEGA